MMTKIARQLAWRACCSTGKKTPGGECRPTHLRKRVVLKNFKFVIPHSLVPSVPQDPPSADA